MMKPPLEILFSPTTGIELIYSFVIIVCSLMIYHSTKEAYKLSSYKGLKYFRQAFLFFAIAYLFRSSIKILLMFFDAKRIIDVSPMGVGIVSLFVFLYFSSMAVFYLVYSIMWKKWESQKMKGYIFNGIALIIAFIGAFFININLLIMLNLGVLAFASFALSSIYKKSKKKRSLFVTYVLLFLFWILNVIEIIIPDFLQSVQLGIYLISISLFMVILYKVLKTIGN